MLRSFGFDDFAVLDCGFAKWFAFMVAAVAMTTMTGRPLRDSMQFAHGGSKLAATLREASRIGKAASYSPDPIAIRKMRKRSCSKAGGFSRRQ